MTYNTKQRQAILNYLAAHARGHVTAKDIITHLLKSGSRVGSSTVYRFLDKLVSEGKLRSFHGSEGACYQWIESSECRNHYHFICGGCGNLFHIECGNMDRACSHILTEHNFHIDLSKTVFCGLCDHCSSS